MDNVCWLKIKCIIIWSESRDRLLISIWGGKNIKTIYFQIAAFYALIVGLHVLISPRGTQLHSRNLKGGSQVSLWPLCDAMGLAAILKVMHGGWVIVPLNLTQSFSSICAIYHAWLSLHKKGCTHWMELLDGLSNKKIRRYNNSNSTLDSKMAASKMADSLFKFPWLHYKEMRSDLALSKLSLNSPVHFLHCV